MMHYFLGMQVWQSVDGTILGQGKYAVEILNRFGMMDCKAITTPMESNLKLLSDASLEAVDATMYRQMIGSFMYLTNTRPDICFTVNTLSQFLTDPRHVHLIAAKHILRHLRVQLIMGSSMSLIKRLTQRVMWIQIGKEVRLRGRALRGVSSVWDQV